MGSQVPVAVRLYGAVTRLLPPDLRQDREGIVRVFAALWDDASSPGVRARLVLRGLGALLVVLVLEWIEFVGVRHAPGRTRRERGGMGLRRHFRFALRTLRRAPAFALTSTLLVAVGVGSVTAIFTLVDHVLLRPLAYPDADRLVTLDRGSFQGPYYRELETMHTVRHWEAAWPSPVNLTGEGDPLRLREARVSRGFLDLFGARAQRGRLLEADDFRATDVVVLSARTWHSVWGSDPSVVGKTIQLDGKPVTVVGIADDGFAPPAPLVGDHVDVWRPLDWSLPALSDHTAFVLNVAGRLGQGESVASAQAEVDAVSAHMATMHENYRNRDGTPELHAVQSLSYATVRGVRTPLHLLMGAVGLVLLVACADVALLSLARGLGRTHEMAVRRAMGAGTSVLTVQLLVESLLVGLLGGALGTGLGWAGIRGFLAANPEVLPRQASVALDPAMLGFALAVSVVTSVAFGLVPVLRAVSADPGDELRGAGRTATVGWRKAGVQRALVTAELTLSLVLVAGAGLLLRSFLAVRAVDPGFSVADVWTIPLNLRDPGTPDHYRQIMDGILGQIRDVPGVESAAYALTAPLEYSGGGHCCWMDPVKVPGRDHDRALNAYVHPISQEYFTTLGEKVVAGKVWNPAEATADPVPVVVNETLARTLAGSTGAVVGRAFALPEFDVVVTGVVRDNRHFGLDQVAGAAVYVPAKHLDWPPRMANVMVKVDPATFASAPQALRRAVWAAQPDVPIPTVRSLQGALDRSTAGRRFDALVSGAFAAVALLLAAGGLYGTLLYVAGQRKREMGIRLALGASRARVEATMLRSGLTLGTVGITLGLVGAWGSNRLLRSRIWGVGSDDPVALAGAALALLLTAALASWLPARRAGRVDPVETLRVE